MSDFEERDQIREVYPTRPVGRRGVNMTIVSTNTKTFEKQKRTRTLATLQGLTRKFLALVKIADAASFADSVECEKARALLARIEGK